MKKSTQQDRIIAILYEDRTGLTRNEINRVTRKHGREIPIQTLCRRLPELVEMGMVVTINKRKCPVTGELNAIYRLSGSLRSVMTRQRARVAA